MVKAVRSKGFLDLWRAVYLKTNPGPERSRWRIGEVEWTRQTHSFRGRDYSLWLEIHRLRRDAGTNRGWSVLVVAERWWEEGRTDAFRTVEWRRVLSGKDSDVVSWLTKEWGKTERGADRAG